MAHGSVVAIYISPIAGEPMQSVTEVEAITGRGLVGDRYATGEGSFNRGVQGRRQITLINGIFFKDTGFEYIDSRRNIVTLGVELMDLVAKRFRVGGALLRGIKYCDPCDRPSKLSGKPNFKEAFHDRGGLIAEVLEGGIIRIADPVVPPPKNY